MQEIPEGFELVSEASDIPEGFELVDAAPMQNTMSAEQVDAAQAERINALPELTGILSGQNPAKVAALSPLLMTTTDTAEFGKILESNFPEIGVVQTPEGEFIAVNNKTGSAARLNKPGLSQADVLQGLGVASAFFPAGMVSAIPAALGKKVAAGAATSGLTQSAIEGGQALAGGDFDSSDVALSAGLGGAAETILPAASAIRSAVSGSGDQVGTQAAKAIDAQAGLKEATGVDVDLFAPQKTMNQDDLVSQRLVPQLKGGAQKAANALKKQNQQVFDAASELISLTGAADSLTMGGQRFKSAAEKVVENARNIRKEKASPFYNEAFKDAEKNKYRPNLKPVNDVVKSSLSELPEGGKIYNSIKKAANLIDNSKTLRQLHGAKIEIDELINAGGESSLTNTGKSKLRDIQSSLLKQMDLASPLYGKARAEFAKASPAFEEVNKGVIGGIATKNDLKNISADIFDAKQVNPNVLNNAKKLIEEVDPQAWNDILRIETQRRIGGVKELITDNPDAVANTPAQIKRALFGNPSQRKVFLSAMNPSQRQNYLYLEEVLGRAAAGRAQGSPTAAFEGVKDRLKGSALAMRDFLFSPIKTVGGIGEEAVKERNTSAFADIIFDPSYFTDLAKIRSKNQNAPATAKALAQLLDDAALEDDQLSAEQELHKAQ